MATVFTQLKYQVQRNVAQKKWRSPFYILYIIRHAMLNRLVRHRIISFPKSGRTWVRYFLAQYFVARYGVLETLSYRTLLKRHASIPRYQCDHFNFTASIEELETQMQEMSGCHVLFLVRDPRDVVVSLYKHSQHRQNIADSRGLAIEEFIRHPRLGVHHIVSYMNTCLKYKDSYASFQIVSYEELRTKSPTASFTSILHFLDQKPVDNAAFDSATQVSSFSQMKQAEAAGVHSDRALMATDVSNPESFKVRSGKVGGYTAELSDADIQYCNNAMTSLDPVFGYAVT